MDEISFGNNLAFWSDSPKLQGLTFAFTNTLATQNALLTETGVDVAMPVEDDEPEDQYIRRQLP